MPAAAAADVKTTADQLLWLLLQCKRASCVDARGAPCLLLQASATCSNKRNKERQEDV